MSTLKSTKAQPDSDLDSRIAERDAEIARLKEQLAKSSVAGRITFKVNDHLLKTKDANGQQQRGKAGISICGLQRGPVVLYAGQLERFTGPSTFQPCESCAPHLGVIPALHKYIDANRKRCAWSGNTGTGPDGKGTVTQPPAGPALSDGKDYEEKANS